MKNTIKFLGIIALAAAIGFSMTSCGGSGGGGGGGGNDVIPSQWVGVYMGGDGSTVTLLGDGTMTWEDWNWEGANSGGPIPGFSTRGGGTLQIGGETVGTWVYLALDSDNVGVIIHVPGQPAGQQRSIAIGAGSYTLDGGRTGMLELRYNVTDAGASWHPEPDCDGFPTSVWFGGNR